MSEWETPQQAFDEFWKPIVCDPQGFFNPEAIKNELFDYVRIMDNVTRVYDYATGCRVTKPLTHVNVVTQKIDEHHEEVMKDHLQDLYDIMKHCATLDQALEEFREYADVG